MEEQIGENLVLLVAIGTLSSFTFIGGVLTFIILYQKKVMKSQKEKQELETQFQKDLFYSYIETQEKERKRIAADLHDNVGASLAAVKMMINRVKLTSETENQLLNDCKEIIQETANSTREISHNLLPPSLETLGLIKVLKRMFKNIQSEQLTIQFTAPKELLIHQKVELALFRISQELINNTLKYANATLIIVKLIEQNSNIIFEYYDNGIGYETEQSNGLGIKNIITRVEMIDGSYEFISEPNKRTGVKIKVNVK